MVNCDLFLLVWFISRFEVKQISMCSLECHSLERYKIIFIKKCPKDISPKDTFNFT